MNSYHVFISARDGVPRENLEARMTSFLKSQIRDNHLHTYRILRHSGNGNFKEMPEYQVICDYETESELEKAFAQMKPDRYKQGPHASLMTMVKEFRVSFSKDVPVNTG